MALEIERKFFLEKLPKDISTYPSLHILQGYFHDAKKKNVRLRQETRVKRWKTSISYYKTIKTGHWLVKEEQNTPITKATFDKLWKQVTCSLEKIRYELPYKKYLIQIDVYSWSLRWLFTAEVEFSDEKKAKAFVAPDYFWKELTMIKEASNAYLAKHGMKKLLSLLSHNIKEELSSFYTAQAEKYYLTRKKHRSTWERVVSYLMSLGKKNITILELWCWGWRLVSYLREHLPIPFTYTWVDFSEWLLAFAKKDHPKETFVLADMVDYLPTLTPESFDVVISVAAFHHLPTAKERIVVLQHVYALLAYWWHVLMINWSLSRRFLNTYRKHMLRSFWKYLYTFGAYDWKDILIPWTHQGKTAYRFYHLFSCSELTNLAQLAWFSRVSCTPIDNNWKDVSNMSHAHNSLLTAEKQVFLEDTIENR